MTGKIIQTGRGASSRGGIRLFQRKGSLLLVDGPLREVVAVRLQVERAKGLLVLRNMLPQHVAQGLGLLRAEEDRAVVADGDLVGGVGGSQAEDQLEVPDAGPDLH